jgi:hypothetical protein
LAQKRRMDQPTLGTPTGTALLLAVMGPH